MVSKPLNHVTGNELLQHGDVLCGFPPARDLRVTGSRCFFVDLSFRSASTRSRQVHHVHMAEVNVSPFLISAFGYHAHDEERDFLKIFSLFLRSAINVSSHYTSGEIYYRIPVSLSTMGMNLSTQSSSHSSPTHSYAHP